MSTTDYLSVEYLEEILEPRGELRQVWKKIPEASSDRNLLRLGLLCEKLTPVDRKLLLETSGTPATNDDIEVQVEWREDLVKERIEKLEQSALGEASHILFSQTEYRQEVLDVVEWLLWQSKDDLTRRRKRAIGEFCEQTGLTGVSDDDASDDREPFDEDPGIEMPHVGKL